MVKHNAMVKESLPELYILILIVFDSAFIGFGRRVWRGCSLKWWLWGVQVRVGKN